MKEEFVSYSKAIHLAFEYLLDNHKEVFIMGQGVWSPWYVGNTMIDLDKKYGIDRIIDTPVSESACTGAALGASITGMRPIIVHPRMDFMLYAMDSIVNEAAKWSYMFGGQSHPNLTIRAILNRGGEQGAQHSQALHSWFAHVPGIRVVMPSTVQDARDLLIYSVLCNDPVLYIDDRWLYDEVDVLDDLNLVPLKAISPKFIHKGEDLTIVGAGYSSNLGLKAAKLLYESNSISCDVIDLRVINPFNSDLILKSVERTGRLLVIDGGWKTCSLSSEIFATTLENIDTNKLKVKPLRLTLQNTPAPTASNLEKEYYISLDKVKKSILDMMNL